jgi:hypothetical protein
VRLTYSPTLPQAGGVHPGLDNEMHHAHLSSPQTQLQL